MVVVSLIVVSLIESKIGLKKFFANVFVMIS
jgi:hypothetical protein